MNKWFLVPQLPTDFCCTLREVVGEDEKYKELKKDLQECAKAGIREIKQGISKSKETLKEYLKYPTEALDASAQTLSDGLPAFQVKMHTSVPEQIREGSQSTIETLLRNSIEDTASKIIKTVKTGLSFPDTADRIHASSNAICTSVSTQMSNQIEDLKHAVQLQFIDSKKNIEHSIKSYI